MRILITGGAGSLGRAFVRLLEPDHDVVVVDSSEWALAEIRSMYTDVECSLADFADYPITGFEDVIIHCAAHKHVNLGEENASAFVENNLTKTIRLYDKMQGSIGRVLYISTDKSVEPISVYGATKMIAEHLTWEIGGQVARLGNILSSTGSVIPLWEKAISEKRPIPITDPEMVRYVLDAQSMAILTWEGFLQGKKLIIPDMGEPVRILDMMATVLKKHGYKRPGDYTPGVTIIGMRPGEKKSEKLIWDHEHA